MWSGVHVERGRGCGQECMLRVVEVWLGHYKHPSISP